MAQVEDLSSSEIAYILHQLRSNQTNEKQHEHQKNYRAGCRWLVF